VADHAFVQGLLKTRNDVRDKLCKTWPAHQFGVLCKRIKMQKFIPFKKVFMRCEYLARYVLALTIVALGISCSTFVLHFETLLCLLFLFMFAHCFSSIDLRD